MQKIACSNVQLSGELAARNYKNLARLHDRYYRPGIVGTKEAENVGWPGDWEGRTILALTLLAQTLKCRPAYLDDIVAEILSQRNAGGYRGEPLNTEAINEQQLAGHGWLLRGLAEYHLWTGDMQALDAVRDIVANLYLPLRGRFSRYPASKALRGIYAGEAAGSLAAQVEEWLLSTDTGCAFIALDGLSQAYELLRTETLGESLGEALGELLDEMLEALFRIDFREFEMQTHASLTGIRGVMRMYGLTGRRELLDKAASIFELYKREGMTENFANYNHFRTPSWTEPCGIIDSYMLALALWEHTGEAQYLEDAHAIWYNGVERGQRPSGGFGCDTCVEDGRVGAHDSFYEAYWCCSMRGGEGLGVPVRHALYETEDEICLPVYLDATLRRELGGRELLRETSRYPLEGRIELEVLEGSGRRTTVRMYLPAWAVNARVTVGAGPIEHRVEGGFVVFDCALAAGERIALCFDIPLAALPTQGYYHEGMELSTLRHGVLVLGAEEGYPGPVRLSELAALGGGRYADGGERLRLAPLNGSYLLEEQALKARRYQVLFRV